MAPRLGVTAAIAVGAATCLAIAGCGDGGSQAAGGPDPPASYVAAVDALVQDPGLRRHRDRLAAAYARLVPLMPPVVAALAGGDRAALEPAATPFLDALRTLPSGASSSSR